MNEILQLQWSHVDRERKLLLLPDSKTGAKTVYLSDPALAIIKEMTPVPGNPYVLPGHQPGKPILSLRKPWENICKAAKLENFRLHDLRHSFASIGINGDVGMAMLQGLLGHSQPATTARYAHLGASPLHAAVNAIGAAITAQAGFQKS